MIKLLRSLCVLILFLCLVPASAQDGSSDQELEDALNSAMPGEDTDELPKVDDNTTDIDFSGEGEESNAENKNVVPDEGNEVPQDLQPLEETPATPVAPAEPLPSEPIPAEPQPLPPENVAPPVTENPLDDQTPIAGSGDTPDLALESQLHDIYVNFHSRPTSAEQWQALVGERQSESYSIQRRDTLWDISKTLFGDGNYWPKIWSINGRITNPHLIEPGYQIRFIMGDDSDAPSFTITEAGVGNEEPEKEAPSTGGGGAISASDIEIPPPLKPVVPVAKIPPSLPQWQMASRGKYNEAGVEFVRRPILDVKEFTYIEDYAAETPPSPLGRVSEMETGGNSAGSLQYVYVVLSQQANPGDRYVAVMNRGRLLKVNRYVETEGAYSIEVQGEIEIVERVRSLDDSSDTYRALVITSLNPVMKGADLVRGKLEKIFIDKSGPRSNVVAQIIGGSYDNRRAIYGPSSLVFLNRGSADGLVSNQILPIRSNRRMRVADTKLRYDNLPIGYVQVGLVEENFATAVVVSAWDDIRTGDLTGDGDVIMKVDAANTLQPAKDESEVDDIEGEPFSDDMQDGSSSDPGDPAPEGEEESF